MDVLIHHTYRADRKERLAAMVRRVLDAFAAASLVPEIAASFADSPVEGTVSAVDRALKKYPELAAYVNTEPVLPGMAPTRRLVGDPAATPLPMDALLALAEGVPRSLPFDSINVHFGHPEFDGAAPAAGAQGGIIIGDNWWVNGRRRSLMALYTATADPESSELPSPPPAVGAVIDVLGPPRKTATQVVPDTGEASDDGAAAALSEVVGRYRAGMAEVIERASPPHDLPPVDEVLGAAAGSGPLKPSLVAAFGPRGFDCRGESGRFVLRRRTDRGNHVVVDLDVGTWSRMVTAQYRIHGTGVNVRLWLPVGVRAAGALQYPIGDTDNWERIVANYGAMVDELDRTFLAEIEDVVGGSPDWYDPGT